MLHLRQEALDQIFAHHSGNFSESGSREAEIMSMVRQIDGKKGMYNTLKRLHWFGSG